MRINQIFLNIFYYAQLIFQTEALLLVTARILKIHTCFRSNIRQLVLSFEAFNISIHTSQFTFNNEFGGINSNLILVIDHILIINGNKHIQNILRTGSGYIIQNQIYNRSCFTGKRYINPS